MFVIGCILRGSEDAGVAHLLGEGVAGEHALDDVGAVETVHAVCANDALLAGADAGGCGAGADGVEVGLGGEGGGEGVEEEGGAVPAHVAAFVVEVEVGVMDAVHGGLVGGWGYSVEALRGLFGGGGGGGGVADEGGDKGFIGGFDGCFATALVDEVDEVDVAVEGDLFGEVGAGSRERGFHAADLEGRDWFEVREFGPVDGDAATGLDIRENLDTVRVGLTFGGRGGDRVFIVAQVAEAASGVTEDNGLFCFIEICDMAGGVEASGEVASAGAVTRFASDEDEGAGSGFDGGSGDGEEAKEGWEDVWVDLGGVSSGQE